MALIICVSKAIKERPVKAEVETLIFEDEEMGRQYVEKHATFVVSVQKANIVKIEKTKTEVRLEKPKPKFEVGQKVRDLLNGRVLTITSYCYFSGWVYSFDSVGIYLYPEEDLEAVNGTA